MNILDLIFPKSCLECAKVGKYICDDCLGNVGKSGWFGKTYSVYKYEGVIRKAIIALKYKFGTEIAQELAEAVCINLTSLNLVYKNYCLVSIPIHKLRKNLRGFNQSEVIGEKLAKLMNWQFEPNLLIKKVATSPQVGLKGDARRKNLANSFSVNPGYILNTTYNILLFDDVMTTGTTLKEAEKELQKSGFKDIWGLTIAR